MVWILLIAVTVSLIVLWRRVGALTDQVQKLSDELQRLRLRGTREEDAAASERPLEELLRRRLREDAKLPPAVERPAKARQPQEPQPLPQEFAPGVSIEEERAAATEGRPAPPTASKQAAPPARPPLKSLDEIIREKLASLGPKDPDMGWEMALGTYWLPRIGIAALSVAVVFLLTLALQKWGPPVRVAIGYGVCAALIGLAWRLEKKARAFARVLFGGGIALTYFVTFATYFVPFARVFETPYVTLALLAVIVAGWAAVAQKRRSAVIAMIATVLGHFTIGLATYSVDEPSRVSVAGIVALSAGSAFFLLRNRWYYVAAVGLVASYANHAFGMARSDAPDEWGVFALSMSVLSVYFLIYASAELFAPERLRRGGVPFWFRSAFVTTNSLGLFLLGSIVMANFSFTREYQHVFRYAVAIVLLAFALAYLRRRAGDPLYNVYMTKGIAAATLGLADQFRAESLAAWLAVEVVVLLYSARRSGLVVTRVLAFAVALIAFTYGLYTAGNMAAIAYGTEAFPRAVASTTLSVIAFLAAALVYQWTNWDARSPVVSRFSDSTRALLWQLDLNAEPPESFRGMGKPLGGLVFPYFYAVAAAALFVAFIPRLAEDGHRLLPLAVFAAGLTCAAWGLRSVPLDAASQFVH